MMCTGSTLLRRRLSLLGAAAALLMPLGYVRAQTPTTPVPPPDMPGVDRAQAAVVKPAVKPADTNKTVALKFNAAPLEQVLQFYSDLTSRTLLQAPSIAATVTLRSQSELTVPEAIQAIKTVLAMNNVGLVDVGEKFVKVVPIATVQTEGLMIQSNAWQDVRHPENDNMISEIIPLKFIDPAEAQKVAAGLIHTYGKILALERINSLMIADTTININRIKEVLQQIDQPIELKEKLHIIQIRYAKASEIKARLEEIIADQKEKDKQPTVKRLRDSGSPGVDTTPQPVATIPGVIRARPTLPASATTTAEVSEEAGAMIRGSVKVIADDRTSILVIITRPENMVFFEQVVAALDVATAPDVSVRMIRLEYADAEVVAAMLNDLIGGSSSKTREPSKTTATTTASGKANEPAEAAKSSPLQEYLQQREAVAQAPKTGAEAKSKIGQLSAENIKILADKRSNGLVIMASKGDMATILDVLKDMDVMLSQVLVEAVILQVSLGDTVKRGVDWVQRSMIAYDRKGNGTRDPIFSFAGSGGGGQGVPRDATTMGSTADFPSGVGGLSYYATLFGLNMDAVIRWSASDSRSKILSSPVILTTDNKEAKIEVTDELYFYKGQSPVSTGGTIAYVPNVEQRKIGLTLTVTPRINAKKFVVMEIQQKIENEGIPQDISGQGTWPTISSREMNASIAVRSGETIVLGGLVQNTDKNTRTKIPLLGDIPILGMLFRYEEKDKPRKEIIVFITPYVLDTPEEIQAESERRKNGVASTGMWQKGWSDSKLADPKPGKFKQWWRNLLH
jgi:general secretion pathway protein D